MYELIVVCVIFTNVNALHVHRSNTFLTTAAVDSFGFNPVASNRLAQNRLEKIDVKGLLHTLNKNGRTKTFANAAEAKRLPFSVEKIDRELDNLKYENEEDFSKSLIEELTVLNTAYNKVSDRIKSVHAAIQKDFDVMMKLHILKGMMMEEKRSKDSEPLIKFLLKYKNHCQNNKYN